MRCRLPFLLCRWIAAPVLTTSPQQCWRVLACTAQELLKVSKTARSPKLFSHRRLAASSFVGAVVSLNYVHHTAMRYGKDLVRDPEEVTLQSTPDDLKIGVHEKQNQSSCFPHNASLLTPPYLLP